jgi:hypothetical protein
LLRYQWFDAGEVPAAKELQAADIVTVLNELKVERADYLGIFDGWSDRLRVSKLWRVYDRRS